MVKIISDGYVTDILSDKELNVAPANVSCGVNLQEEILNKLKVKLVDWSPYSLGLEIALGIFILCGIGLLLVGITALVEFCLGAFKKVALIIALAIEIRTCVKLE
ncbi:unnamed protein product [Dibothriocephalus latus]|uniref:Uncharacterized protein n=1 Tax=Dibothriocephalus latus TaxID=60516 RepID=A0A3P7NWX5_DIBLA|nr:unnamed protein product [Dibothriocephalus latus]